MEDNEALERKLPIVESVESEISKESISSVQMELPSADPTAPTQQLASQLPQSAPTAQFAVTSPSVASGITPLTAEDIDLIEKAWIEKAKAIVRSTHGDPYNQNKELNKVKAEYIKKRYDKDIKVIE